MVVLWQGFGFLVPVQVFAILIVCQLGVDGVMGSEYYTTHEWPKQVAVVVSSLSLWPVGLWLNGRNPEAVDPSTGELPPKRAARHTLFFVPYQHWAWIAPALWLAVGFTV